MHPLNIQSLGAQFVLLNVLRRNMVRKKTAGYELQHGQLPLLETLIANPGCTQQELSDTLRVSPASVAQSVARLARTGLIEKRVDPHNKRCNRLCATDAGKQAAALYRTCFDEVNAFTFAGLDAAELEQLSALFRKIIKNFGEDPDSVIWPPICCKEGPSR